MPESKNLWGGRFEGKADPGFVEFNNSFRFDRRLFEADIIASMAYSRALEAAGVFSAEEGNEVRSALDMILEKGRATSKVLEDMIVVWKEAGPAARDIFIMQKLNTVMTQLVSTVGAVRVDRITMLPANNGSGDTARTAVRLVEELKGALGVDLPKLLESAMTAEPSADRAPRLAAREPTKTSGDR